MLLYAAFVKKYSGCFGISFTDIQLYSGKDVFRHHSISMLLLNGKATFSILFNKRNRYAIFFIISADELEYGFV